MDRPVGATVRSVTPKSMQIGARHRVLNQTPQEQTTACDHSGVRISEPPPARGPPQGAPTKNQVVRQPPQVVATSHKSAPLTTSHGGNAKLSYHPARLGSNPPGFSSVPQIPRPRQTPRPWTPAARNENYSAHVTPFSAAAQIYSASDNMKVAKGKFLDTIMKSIVGFCPVCWFLTDQFNLRQTRPDGVYDRPSGQIPHDPFNGVCSGMENIIELGIHDSEKDNWTFHKSIVMPANCSYCFNCHLPQDFQGQKFRPFTHPEMFSSAAPTPSSSRGYSPSFSFTANPCPWKDIVGQCLFALYFHEELLERLNAHFQFAEDSCTMSIGKWLQWIVTSNNDSGEFYNGLELFMYRVKELGFETTI